MSKKPGAAKTVRDIRRATRRHYSAEEKIRIVLEGLRAEDSIAELCRREGINANVYYCWSEEFLEAGKKRLSGDTAREATSDEVKKLCSEASALKETLAELLMENACSKKAWPGMGRTAYEIFGRGEVRDYPAGRVIESVGSPNAQAPGYPSVHFLQLVASFSGQRHRWPRRPQANTDRSLEPDPAGSSRCDWREAGQCNYGHEAQQSEVRQSHW